MVLAVMLAAAGLYVSLLVKHLDNLVKTFTTSLGIVVNTVATVVLFGATLTPWFYLGTVIVIASLLLYSSTSE